MNMDGSLFNLDGCEGCDESDFHSSNFGEERSKDKKSLSMGLLVPDAVQFICSEGLALKWDQASATYEVKVGILD